MIKERNKLEFFKIYSKRRLVLKKRHCCRMYTRIEYYPNYGVRLSCMCGEGVLILKKDMYPDLKSEEDFVCFAVTEWNTGHTNW